MRAVALPLKQAAATVRCQRAACQTDCQVPAPFQAAAFFPTRAIHPLRLLAAVPP